MAAQFEAPIHFYFPPLPSLIEDIHSMFQWWKLRSRQHPGQGFTQKCVSQGHLDVSVIYYVRIFLIYSST